MFTKRCLACGEVKTTFKGNACMGCSFVAKRISPASGGAHNAGRNRVGAPSQIKTA